MNHQLVFVIFWWCFTFYYGKSPLNHPTTLSKPNHQTSKSKSISFWRVPKNFGWTEEKKISCSMIFPLFLDFSQGLPGSCPDFFSRVEGGGMLYITSIPVENNWQFTHRSRIIATFWPAGCWSPQMVVKSKGISPKIPLPSLKLTFSPLKMDGLKTSFLLGWPIFRGYVSFRGCNSGLGIIGSFAQPVVKWCFIRGGTWNIANRVFGGGTFPRKMPPCCYQKPIFLDVRRGVSEDHENPYLENRSNTKNRNIKYDGSK